MHQYHLLSDEQVKSFLIKGFLVIKPTSACSALHKQIREKTLSLFQNEGNPGNNILPRVPQLAQIYNDPAVSGALRSLLGDGYTMLPHRHCHVSSAGFEAQEWHRDSYWGYRKPIRNHHPRYVMAMYYPQRVDDRNGPTAARAGTQYLERWPLADHTTDLPFDVDSGLMKDVNSDDNGDDDVTFEVDEGDVVIIHFDILHRATKYMQDDGTRLMFKFQFYRLGDVNPISPSWNCVEREWDAQEAPELLRPMVRHTWQWMTGKYARDCGAAVAADGANAISANIIGDRSALSDKLFSRNDVIRANAAYQLAEHGYMDFLLGKLVSCSSVLTHIVHGLCASVPHWDKEFIASLKSIIERRSDAAVASVCWLISEIGGVAHPSLVAETVSPMLQVVDFGADAAAESHVPQDSKVWVRLYAVEALANVAQSLCRRGLHDDDVQQTVPRIVDSLIHRLQNDPDDQVRFTVALGLGKIACVLGQSSMHCDEMSSRMVSALVRSIQSDTNRYVVGNALLALKCIATQESMDHYIQLLESMRWCNFTTRESLY